MWKKVSLFVLGIIAILSLAYFASCKKDDFINID